MQTSIPDSARVPLLCPDWPAPPTVRAFVTLRPGGFSRGAWGLAGGAPGGWNLGAHCGDDAADVARNRAALRSLLPAEPVWLNQVHGTCVLDADIDEPTARHPTADAAVTSRPARVLAVMTADCLSVFLTNLSGTALAVAHAGWRGLCAGVLENALEALARKTADHRWIAWLGPAIGPSRFEVGEDVRSAFLAHSPGAAAHFRPTGAPGKWLGDLPGLARTRLSDCGVVSVSGGEACTVSDPARFYSFRRDRETGRMASVAWLA